VAGGSVRLRFFVPPVRQEFEEAPDLRLSLSEAARFWGLDPHTCEGVLAQLLSTGFLIRGADRRYRPA
jgi:DNA-binding IclR family transcriptional regulator